MEHSNLTIVAVYGHNDGSSAIASLVKSMTQLPGSKAVLISPSRPDSLPSFVEHKAIFALDYFQYSWFMMYALHNFIDTDYALVVQDDGWVIDGTNFDPDWYSYDYIGAPTHCALIGNQYYWSWTWQQQKEPMHIIQNGGLSLRSKRMMQAPGKHGIIHRAFNVQPFCNEDVQLSGFMRNDLEKVGMRYAPDQVAKYFSMEYMGPGYHDGFDFDKLFGCHAPTRKLVSANKLMVDVTKNPPENMYGEKTFLDYLLKRGYEIVYFKQQAAEQDRTQEADSTVL
jgi:hypothetical protein